MRGSLFVDEDAYWEDYRENLESWRIYDDEPYYEDGILFMEDYYDEVKETTGYSLEELADSEGDLIDLVVKYTGICPETAKYDANLCCIDYTYEPDPDDDY